MIMFDLNNILRCFALAPEMLGSSVIILANLRLILQNVNIN